MQAIVDLSLAVRMATHSYQTTRRSLDRNADDNGVIHGGGRRRGVATAKIKLTERTERGGEDQAPPRP